MRRASARAEQAPDVRCEDCGKLVPRLQSTRCASCKRGFCRLCVSWYGHFMLVCDECRTGDW